LKGEISNAIQPAQDALLNVIVRLESSIEFVEEDLPTLEQEQLIISLRQVSERLAQLRDTFHAGRLLRDGLTVALIGRPNVGKSSLFNSLLGRGRAIVTEIPGTTRDTLTESVGINGVPILLIDTAGIRPSIDPIESIGVERTKRTAGDADLLIVVIDGSENLQSEDHLVLAELDHNHIVALNKSDLSSFSPTRFNGEVASKSGCRKVVSVSAKTDAGLDELRAAIVEPFANGRIQGDGLLITNARHHDLLSRAVSAIQSSQDLILERASEEIVLVGLHNALRYLGEITGETTADDILGQIFSTFCIGK
jgi:tRNA modification GTPase